MATLDNLSDGAYNQIKYRIIHFDYLPGQKISEKVISNELELGRTPVREAIIRIEREGLIEVIPQSGTYITQIDMSDADDGRFVRECIEPKVTSIATVHLSDNQLDLMKKTIEQQRTAIINQQPDNFFDLDQKFHNLFYKVTDNQKIWDWLQINNTQLNRFRRLRLKQEKLNWETILSQHTNLYNAVSLKDLESVQYIITRHLHLMLEEKDNVVSAYPDYFTNY
ncbi:GntR family transcriptional regulator [Lentilactobacillus sp. Marseille-Q4993]|uniref:GntR family transcriptional regulator n=1 Tax=Lentilactobacillus sp. Marseille-Q4993 TaxID=3039492 RepID=UPI0024BCF6FE|nr:GntR family transcriptional regulator [Lentilactobacillus sp. Marseille-Q4993]